MITVTTALLRAVAPVNSGARRASQDAIISAAGPALQVQLPAAGIDTPLRIAHFLAQICEESDGFCTTEEYATGEAYEGRADLGNTEPGDGVLFKGRGLIEITGRFNYGKYDTLVGLPLLAHPQIAALPLNAVKIAISFWTQHGLNAYADKNDIVTITKRINGGENGLDTRRFYLARALRVLGPPTA